MNFVNTLHTKKELEEEFLEIFNQWWFTQGKNLITKTIKYVVCSDCVDMLYNINAYAWYSFLGGLNFSSAYGRSYWRLIQCSYT